MEILKEVFLPAFILWALAGASCMCVGGYFYQMRIFIKILRGTGVIIFFIIRFTASA